MALIRANRESIDDRFSVLGFTVRTETPLFEVGLATDPDLLKAENRARRTRSNFFSSQLLGASRKRDSDSVYLVPPSVVARFAGQSRLYFGLATYQEGNRSQPVDVRIPDRGHMYVNLSGLTERGLRRTARPDVGNGYGNHNADGLKWGGDAIAAGPEVRIGNGAAPSAAPKDSAPYSDGYSDELWKQGAATAPSAPPTNATPPTTANTPSPAPADTSDGPRLTVSQGYGGTASPRPPARPYAKPLLVEPYNQPSSWWDNLTTQIGHFARGAMWFLGVSDTTQPPFSAICQVRKPDGSTEGAHLGTAFFIGPRLLLTAAHVVDGETELIIVPGKNGAGTGRANEPFGRFRVTQFRKHGSYGTHGEDNDMALICVPAANAASAPNYFGLVEELTQSRPEGVVVSGYAAWWHATSTIEEYVNKNIDENRQHAHGGYIRELPTDGTFTYDLQTLAGTSGSPVYWIEGGPRPVAHLVGVHVAANDNRTNLGCRITQEKLDWIRQTAASWGQALTFSLGVRVLEETAGVDDNDDPEIYAITGDEPENAEALVAAQGYVARGLDAPRPDYPDASRFAAAHANNFRVGRKNNTAVDRIVIHITAGGPKIDGTIAWFQNGNRVNERTGKRIQSSAHYIVGRDGEVVQMVRNADTAWHASQVNSRSIGIEHNANKPTRSNPRDLPPTDAQYEASARLVAWLCQQYGLPADRDHIVGHLEASPRDNHDCPSSYWDWDHYMACVQVAVGQLAAPATSQSVRALGAVAHALDIITPYYDPADPASALACQADTFSLAREEWFAGVPNTTIFPHSAICLLEMKNASGAVASRGTGFYIGPNRILTCGHNLFDANYASVDVIPGKNGQGAGTEPFGRFNVPRGQWRIPTSYGGSNPAFDLAVIDNVPNAAPGGQWFDVLEELNQSRPEGVVVCGYSSRSPRVPELTAAIDGFKQHLHAGYIAALGPGDGTFDYPILTLKRASGAPVYYISNKEGANKAYIVGVHTGSASDDLNRGCRLTNAKIDWIEGRTTSLSLGYGGARNYRVRSLAEAIDEDASRGIEGPIPDDAATSQSLAAVGRALSAPSPEYPQASRFVPADSGNYRASTSPRTIECIVIHITDGGANINGTIGWFQNPAAKVSAHYVIGQDGEVVQMVKHNDVAWHARSANRTSIGIEHVANTRGLNPTPAQMCASAALVTWLCDTYGIPVDRAHILGHSEADTGTTHTGCPNAVWDWNYYMGLVNSRTCYAPDSATAQSLGARGFGPRALEGGSDYPVHLIPQPDKNSCWAASMAMLYSFRRNLSLTPETLANDVGASLATSYGWDLLKAVRERYGFEMIREPDNTSLYHSPQQWADWLATYGPLWVVIVGAPHAVVLAGIRGNLADSSSVQVKILNPWDTRVAFDNDAVTFNPGNHGYEDWLSFNQFAGDFGNMAEPNYGNWRVLHLPASAAAAQSLGAGGQRLKVPPAPIRALNLGEVGTATPGTPGETREPIEPSRVAGTRMHLLRGRAGGSTWALDQLEGLKSPSSLLPSASSASPAEVTIALNDWPAIDGAPCPLPLTINFKGSQGSVGDVSIRAGMPANLAYGVEATARIDDCGDLGGVAALKVTVDYRFSGLAQGNPAARIELRLLGDGRYERENCWLEPGMGTRAA